MGVLKKLLVEDNGHKNFSTVVFAGLEDLQLPDDYFYSKSITFAVTAAKVINELYPHVYIEYEMVYDLDTKLTEVPRLYITSDDFHLYSLTSKGLISEKKLYHILDFNNPMSLILAGNISQLRIQFIEKLASENKPSDPRLNALFKVDPLLKQMLINAFTKKPDVDVQQLFNLLKTEYNWLNPFYRGMSGNKAKPFGVGKTFSNRKPRDTDNFIHELVEILRTSGMDKWAKIPSRKQNALFLTKDMEAAKIYGYLYYVFLPNEPIVVSCNRTDQTDDMFIPLAGTLENIRNYGDFDELIKGNYPFLEALCNSENIQEYLARTSNQYDNLYKAVTDEIMNIQDNPNTVDEGLFNKYISFWAGVGNYFVIAQRGLTMLQPNIVNKRMTDEYYEFVVNIDRYLYIRQDVFEDNFEYNEGMTDLVIK